MTDIDVAGCQDRDVIHRKPRRHLNPNQIFILSKGPIAPTRVSFVMLTSSSFPCLFPCADWTIKGTGIMFPYPSVDCWDLTLPSHPREVLWFPGIPLLSTAIYRSYFLLCSKLPFKAIFVVHFMFYILLRVPLAIAASACHMLLYTNTWFYPSFAVSSYFVSSYPLIRNIILLLCGSAFHHGGMMLKNPQHIPIISSIYIFTSKCYVVIVAQKALWYGVSFWIWLLSIARNRCGAADCSQSVESAIFLGVCSSIYWLLYSTTFWRWTVLSVNFKDNVSPVRFHTYSQ
jgi:hypothetical protein